MTTERSTLERAIVATWQPSADGQAVPTVAVLFGWMGATHPHLAKYSRLFRDHSMSTIQHIADHRVWPGHTRARAAAVLDMLLARLGDGEDVDGDHPFHIVFHVMSNGGLIPYIQALKLLDHDKKYARLAPLVRGTLIDSAPAYLSIASGAHAFSSPWIKSNFIVRTIMFLLFSAFMSVGSVLYYLFTGKPVNNYAQFHYLESSPLQRRIPLLFLYSKDDHITDYKYIESFMNALKRAGVEVDSRCFKSKSAHVAHLYHHKDEYVEQVDSFLRRIL